MKYSQRGSALLPFVIVLPFLILIAGYSMSLAASSYRLARNDQMNTHAQLATDAGIDYAMNQISANQDWACTPVKVDPCTPDEVELHNDGQIKTTYEVSVANPNPNSKVLTAIGRTYRPATAASPESTVKVVVDLRPVKSGDYSVVAGAGGLYMSNSAKVLGGAVFVNGEVVMQNFSQIGLSTDPVTLDVAHQICPAPSDPKFEDQYPRVCDPGESGEPIAIQDSAHIYGDVCANNQIGPEPAMTLDGLIACSAVTPQALPPHDRQAQKDAVVPPEQTGAWASCDSNNEPPRTWPANLKINGDVTIKKKCKIYITGDVWITGNLELSNSAQLITHDSLGETRPNIMVDGQTAKLTNSASLVSNASGTGMQIINYWSNTACSPDCSEAQMTGSNLYNSRNQVTIELDNSAAGPESVFYARWARLQVNNAGQIGAVVGQTIELKNSATVTFGTAAGGEVVTSWIIDGYRRTFD